MTTSPPISRTSQVGVSRVLTASLPTLIRRHALLVFIVVLFAVIALVTTRPAHSSVPYAVTNPTETGAQALRVLLDNEGVTVRSMSSFDDVMETIHDSDGPVTVALLHAGSLSVQQQADIASSGADITVLGTLYEHLAGLSTTLDTSGDALYDPIHADCDDPDAVAAGSIDGSTAAISSLTGIAPDSVTLCFPLSSQRWGYAVSSLDSGATLRVLADRSIITNERLADSGHAALAIRSLGHNPTVLWFDAAQSPSPSVWESPSGPTWLFPLGAQVLLTIVIAAVTYGRRCGRLASENLPVIVHATETTRGRGRLYRQAADRERVATTLRAGCAMRVGRRLGLPPSADPGTVRETIAHATGLPAETVEAALYGLPPTTDQSLAQLAADLDRIESEVFSS